MPTNLKNYLTLPNLFLIKSALLFRCMDQALELVAEMIYECEVASKNWSTYFGIRSQQADKQKISDLNFSRVDLKKIATWLDPSFIVNEWCLRLDTL